MFVLFMWMIERLLRIGTGRTGKVKNSSLVASRGNMERISRRKRIKEGIDHGEVRERVGGGVEERGG